MEKKKIIITGINGTVGQVLKAGLSDYQIMGLDLPESDVRRYKTLASIAAGHSAIIHLAWDTKVDNFQSGKISPDNTQMFFNVYQAALEFSIPKVIVASSVHADRFYGWQGSDYLSPYRLPIPDSPYGAHKVGMEALGRYFARDNLMVVAIRFGGVGKNNIPGPDPAYFEAHATWFSHGDCVSLIKAILETNSIPENFAIVNGVSNSKRRIHDFTNPFGWTPQDQVEDFLK